MRLKSLFSYLLFSSILMVQTLYAQEAYMILDREGKEIVFEEMMDSLKKTQVVFFGEIHNQPLCHWLNLEIIVQLHENGKDLQIGMEMFERDQQRVIGEMEREIFDVSKLSQYTRTWNNYKTDYKPIVELCVENDIPIHATNIPRQYASFVFSHGMDSLYSLDLPAYLIPRKKLPVDTQQVSYAEISKMAARMGHGGGFLLEAQAVKDMMMAETINELLKKNKRTNILHINGVYHTKYGEGIAWYLHHLNPKINSKVISCHEIDEFEKFLIPEHDKADFHILIDQDITKSYE